MGVVIHDDAVLVVLPRRTCKVVLIFRGIGAEVGLRRTAQCVTCYAAYLAGLQSLPVVGATGGVLHHLYFRQVGAVGKGIVAYREVKLCRSIIGSGIRILEVEGLQFRAAVEGMGGDAGRQRMVVEIARQVVVYLRTVAGNLA